MLAAKRVVKTAEVKVSVKRCGGGGGISGCGGNGGGGGCGESGVS